VQCNQKVGKTKSFKAYRLYYGKSNEDTRYKMSESIMLGVSRPNKRFMDASPEQRGNIVNLGVLALDSIEVSKNTESDNKRNEYLEGVIAKLHSENALLVEERELYVERYVTNLKEKVEALTEFNKEKTEVQARHTHTISELNKEKFEEQARHIHTLLELNKVLTEERSCAKRVEERRGPRVI